MTFCCFRQNQGLYIGCTEDGDVYGGRSKQLSTRKKAHANHGLTVVETLHICDPEKVGPAERRLISFLRAQAAEEDFDCTNIRSY
jgi:hypothetical protein